MPIVLNVKSYCLDCGEFSPESESIDITCFGDMIQDKRRCMTTICCEHRSKCDHIYESIKEVKHEQESKM